MATLTDTHIPIAGMARRELEKAPIANHASTCTTELHDRHADEVTLDEIERVGI
jgi:hypothetical protein